MEQFNNIFITEKLIIPALTFLIGITCSWLYFEYSVLNNQKFTIKPQVDEANLALTSDMKIDSLEGIDIEKNEIVAIESGDIACDLSAKANLSFSFPSDIDSLVGSLNTKQITVTEFAELVQSQSIEKQEKISVILHEEFAETSVEDFDAMVENLGALEELALYDESNISVNKIINTVIFNNNKPAIERVNLLAYARNRIGVDSLPLLESIVIEESSSNPELAWEALSLLHDSVGSEERSRLLEGLSLNHSFNPEISTILEEIQYKAMNGENYNMATALNVEQQVH